MVYALDRSEYPALLLSSLGAQLAFLLYPPGLRTAAQPRFYVTAAESNVPAYPTDWDWVQMPRLAAPACHFINGLPWQLQHAGHIVYGENFSRGSGEGNCPFLCELRTAHLWSLVTPVDLRVNIGIAET